MEAHEVFSIIQQEVGENWSISNAHGVDLKKCLLSEPVKISLTAGFGGRETFEMWLVLEEFPLEKSGYKIVFDEEMRKFGLATTDAHTNENVFIGIHGSFLKTLEGM